MNTKLGRGRVRRLAMVICLLYCGEARSQTNVPIPTNPSTPAAPAADFKPEELAQMVAPIALYPDDLLSQVLMASTYPVEIVQADRWLKQHADLKGDALATALEQEQWDPSVKSLINFPQVLTMLSEKLDWTVKLGDAFIAQQEQVMSAIQELRSKALAADTLKATPQQTVIVQEQGPTQVIQIEPADPQVVYVPTYSPSAVYGAWPYPAYPPTYWYPPGYVATAGIAFGTGFACGAAWGYAWGHCNWGNNNIDIDCNRNFNLNSRINRGNYVSHYQRNNVGFQNGRGSWRHDAAHRGGVAYRNPAAARRYGGSSSLDAARARDSYRGRPSALPADRGFGGSGSNAPRGGAGSNSLRGGAGPSQMPSRAQNQPRSPGPSRSATPSRGYQSGRSSAFDGVSRGGATTRQYSSRGNSSRQYSQPGRSAGSSRSSGMRSGSRGGGARGGGGRGGGRR